MNVHIESTGDSYSNPICFQMKCQMKISLDNPDSLNNARVDSDNPRRLLLCPRKSLSSLNLICL